MKDGALTVLPAGQFSLQYWLVSCALGNVFMRDGAPILSPEEGLDSSPRGMILSEGRFPDSACFLLPSLKDDILMVDR